MEKIADFLFVTLILLAILAACTQAPDAPVMPVATPAPIVPQNGENLVTGHAYKMDWDDEYDLLISCADGSNVVRYIALDALNASEAKVSVRGFGWLGNGDNLTAEICEKRQILGTIEVYSDDSSPNGWGVTIHILDKPIPTDRG